MIIIHITDIAHSEGNGVAVAVKNYIKYETVNNKVASFYLNDAVCVDDAPQYSFLEYNKISSLPKPFNKPDLVVFNEVYKPKYIALYKECIKNNIKYIIIPHGCLEEEAQKRKKIKKILGNLVMFNKFISSAEAIQFLTIGEMKHTKFKFKRYIIGGNGTDENVQECKIKYKDMDLVYIGRYEIKHKGLDMLVKICKSQKVWFINNNVKIQLFGRDSSNELIELKKMINDNNVQDILIINGPVYNEEKRKILCQTYSFIQCSRFEGQPMGIIEALSLGVPCIVTYGTNLGEYIEDKKCGLVSKFCEEDIFNNIKYIVENPIERDKMSRIAKENVINDFSWNAVINATIREYQKLIKE